MTNPDFDDTLEGLNDEAPKRDELDFSKADSLPAPTLAEE